MCPAETTGMFGQRAGKEEIIKALYLTFLWSGLIDSKWQSAIYILEHVHWSLRDCPNYVAQFFRCSTFKVRGREWVSVKHTD